MLRPIDAYALNNALVSWYNDTEDETERAILRRVMQMVVHAPTLTPPNEPLTWEGLKSEAKVNPVYSVKYGWIFPSTVKDEPYKQIWFFTSKGFAQTELFYRDTFYRRPPETAVYKELEQVKRERRIIPKGYALVKLKLLEELDNFRELGPIDRLRELAQADREKRIIVIPKDNNELLEKLKDLFFSDWATLRREQDG